MNSFTIADIENLTNIKAHTIRIWEQRYGLCSCKRKSSNHRFYDSDDLKHILRIASLYHKGHKISHIACLSAEEIRQKALGISAADPGDSAFINRLMEASIDLDTETFESVMSEITNQLPFEKVITRILFPFLQKLGLFWLTGRVIPGQEHFASALISKLILLEADSIPLAPDRKSKRRVLLFTPDGEYHEIPLLFMTYLLRKNKVPYAYLGASVSIETLSDYCELQPVSQLYMHLITNLTGYDITHYLHQLSRAFPDKEIYASGICCGAIKHLPDNVKVLKEDVDFEEFVKL